MNHTPQSFIRRADNSYEKEESSPMNWDDHLPAVCAHGASNHELPSETAKATEMLRFFVGWEMWDRTPHLALWHKTMAQKPRLLDIHTEANTPEVTRLLTEAAAAGLASRRSMPDVVWFPCEIAGRGAITVIVPFTHGTLTLSLYFKAISQCEKRRESDRLRASLPALKDNFSLWQDRHCLNRRTIALETVARRSDFPVLLIDRDGRVAFANREASALTFEGAGIAIDGDTIRTQNPEDNFRLRTAVEHCCRFEAGGPSTPNIVLTVERKGRRPITLSVAPGTSLGQLKDQHDGGVHADVNGVILRPTDCVAIVTISDPERTWMPALKQVFDQYGLSGSEARLAGALAHGASLSMAARSLKLREQTARSYLKQIFFKTGTHRQGELIWLLLSSADRVLPPPRESQNGTDKRIERNEHRKNPKWGG